jgi:predicted small metal-binding protein
MKTMTCRDLGGPCALEHRGATADEIITAQDRHLKESVKAGDETHSAAREAMKGRWRHPRESMAWYSGVKRSYEERPSI